MDFSRKSRVFASLILIVLSLSACGRRGLPAVAVPSPILVTPSSVSRQTQTQTPSPSPTEVIATYTATPKPTLTVTPTPFPTEVGIYPFDISNDSQITPTPIPGPLSSVHNYQLKTWTETSVLELEYALEEYANAVNLPGLGLSRPEFFSAQYPIQLLIEETLLRFPEIEKRYLLQWRLALANAMLEDTGTDDWLLSQLQDYLDKGILQPDKMELGFLGYGFDVSNLTQVVNLFGDGKTAWVYNIAPDTYSSNGIFFAVREIADQKYQVITIHKQWFSQDGASVLRDPTDHTGNGIPDILIFSGVQGGILGRGDYYLFEWQGDRFVELTGGISVLSVFDTISFGPPVVNGVPSLLHASMFLTVSDIYAWDGQYFRNNLIEVTENDVDALSELIDRQEYALAVKTIDRYLQLWPDLVSSWSQDLGQSFPDYLLFQSGLLQFWLGHPDQAIEVLQRVANTPANPDTMTVPRAAQAFLDNYQDDRDYYRACQAVERVFKDARFADRQGVISFKAYGYDWNAGETDMCTTDNALLFTMHTLPAEDIIKFPIQALGKAGINVKKLIKQDFDADGKQDVLLFIEDRENVAYTGQIWVVLNGVDQVVPRRLDIRIDATDFQKVRVQPFGTPGAASTSWLFADNNYLSIFTHSNLDVEVRIDKSFSRYTVQDYELGLTGDQVFLSIYSEPDSFERHTLWEVLYSDPLTGEIKPGIELERMVFDPASAAEAIPILKRITTYFPKSEDYLVEKPAYHFYLLGLAYERTGNTQQAVNTYWKLWNEYPGSAYAILAREKLELGP